MRNITKALLLSATTLVGASFANAQVMNADQLDPNATIAENAMKVQNFSTLIAAVQAAGMADALMGDGPFTVFAPTDEAFAMLPEGTVEDLLLPENMEALTSLLQMHVVPGILTADDLATATLQSEDAETDTTTVDSEGNMMAALDTLASRELIVTQIGDALYVSPERGGNATIKIIASDIMSSNGVIHAIDGVLTTAN